MFVDASTKKEKTFFRHLALCEISDGEERSRGGKKPAEMKLFDEASKNMKRLETSYMMWKKFDDVSRLGFGFVILFILSSHSTLLSPQ